MQLALVWEGDGELALESREGRLRVSVMHGGASEVTRVGVRRRTDRRGQARKAEAEPKPNPGGPGETL